MAIHELVDDHGSTADRILLVRDNLYPREPTLLDRVTEDHESPPGRSRGRVDVSSLWRSVRPRVASRHGDPNQVVSASRNPVSVPSPAQAT